MLVSRKTVHSLPPTLTVDGIPLTLVTEYKYLGVTIASNLSWNLHITNICNKTRRLVGMFYRRFYINSSPETLLKLYVAYIRPNLKYCSPVWNPHSKKFVEELENVQKFALKMCMKCWDSNYETLLAATQLPTLEKRRTKASLCHLFKIINKLTHYPDPPIMQWESHYIIRSSAPNRLIVPHSNMAYRQRSFFPSAIAAWNQLPNKARSCNTINSFKCLCMP